MAGIPTCRDCSVPMIAAKGYHAILAFEPPEDLDYEQFSPVSLYVCGKCGHVRFYLAGPESWAREKLEEVSYGYRLSGREPATATGRRQPPSGTEPRRSRA
jgi:hypothetical protein